MAALFLLLSLAYLFASIGLGCYSLLGLCVRPLAATQSFAGGLLVLIALFLPCALAVGGVFGVAVLQSGHARWHEWFILGAALEVLPLWLAVLLPFCLCWSAVRRRLAAVFGVACVCVLCYGRVCLLAAAGA